MANEILSHAEMCHREGRGLQRGMNYRVSPNHSVFLMSLRPNAPYDDKVVDSGQTLIYEGHDARRKPGGPDPKSIDQPERSPTGRLTENGKFHQAAQLYKYGERAAERIHVYDKIRENIWSFMGVFKLVDSWTEQRDARIVFQFRLVLDTEELAQEITPEMPARQRIIPSHVKVAVWKRDRGRCVKCGAQDELHFDHIVPYSKGGTSLRPANIQLLCARHNLKKGDRLE